MCIRDRNYTKELVNGKASIGINLNPGNYTITTFYHYTDGLATKTNNIEAVSYTHLIRKNIKSNLLIKPFQ